MWCSFTVFLNQQFCEIGLPKTVKWIHIRHGVKIFVFASFSDPEVPAKKRKEEESKEDILEMAENTENPLRCPVRLYEFYLSKW